MATKKTEETATNGGAGAETANDGFSTFEKATGDGAELQKIVDANEEQGFIGVKTDPRDNADYTVAGVTKDLK